MGKCLCRQQIEWAYKKWCEGYTLRQIGDALYCDERTVRRAMNGRPKIRPILTYKVGEEKSK